MLLWHSLGQRRTILLLLSYPRQKQRLPPPHSRVPAAAAAVAAERVVGLDPALVPYHNLTAQQVATDLKNR